MLCDMINFVSCDELMVENYRSMISWLLFITVKVSTMAEDRRLLVNVAYRSCSGQACIWLSHSKSESSSYSDDYTVSRLG